MHAPSRSSVSTVAAAAALLVCVAGCAPAPPPDEPPDGPSFTVPDGPVFVGGERATEIAVPSSYDAESPVPFVLLLHGYSGNGAQTDEYLGFTALAEERGFFAARPEGTLDSDGLQFWNASSACCDFYDTNVDDSAWLASLIDEAKGVLNIDAKRTFIIGHSNGGFMAYRMACEHADQIAAFVSIAGAMLSPDDTCAPSEGVSALQVHGTADTTIGYNGGTFGGGVDYPGALESAESWATLMDCGVDGVDGAGRLDLDTRTVGDDTDVKTWDRGCVAGGRAELWTVTGAQHIPSPTPGYLARLVDHLFAHPKP